MRFITFNVNGVRTLTQYHPFNKCKNPQEILDWFESDVITFQELKISQVTHAWGKVSGYHCFISIPAKKQGYSGVGLFIKNSIPIVAAEEGITGCLINTATGYSYKSEGKIGGYEGDSDIDTEGRCCIVELQGGHVVIAVYCPANSGGTEVGEEFRLGFISALFQRIRNLEDMGKKVILMGDINIAKDVIDHAISLEACVTPDEFLSTIPRQMFNVLLKKMHDTTRECQGPRPAMYTVWNTLTNSRPSNFGSRIDYIITSDGINFSKGDIMPQVFGSDHCPVVVELDIPIDTSITLAVPKFEAKYRYGLNSGSVLDMLKKRSNGAASPTQPAKVIKPKPKQSKIMSFFEKLPSETHELPEPSKTTKITFGEVPKCLHNRECVVKVSKKGGSLGKKFYSCGDDDSCDFFKWLGP